MAAAKEATEKDAAPGAKKKVGIKAILFLLIALGGAAGVAGYMGLVKIPGMPELHTETDKSLNDISKSSFLELPRIIVPLGEQANAKHLVSQITVETTLQHAERIEKLKPRLMDMLNTYLRAVDEKELSDPSRFRQLQAQMLRRAKLIAGEAAVKNLLIQEFILQ